MGSSRESRALFQGFPMMGRARAQVWPYSPKYRRPRHFHAEPELNIVVHGSARFGVGDKFVEVRAGELLGFAPGQDHVMLEGSPDLVLLAVAAKEAIATDTSRGGLGYWRTPLHLRPRVADFAALVARAERIAGCADELQAAELWECANALARSVEERNQLRPHVLTRRAVEIVGPGGECDRYELAKHARCHPTELSRHFHRDFGVTLVRYRTRLRLLSFIQHVDVRSRNFAHAAVLAGFGSYSQCHRSFVAELRCPPSEFFSGDVRAKMENAFEPVTAMPA